MMTKRNIATVAGATLLSIRLFSAPSVEITNVQQQYPWTNTVDITYTVAGVKTHQVDKILLTNETYFVAFEAKDADGNVIPDVNGNTVITNALVNGPATEVAQWQPALGRQVANCTAVPSVFRGEEQAYLVINLETNALGKFDWWYEPMSTQEASNKRYNTDEYKTRKLVMRRIKAGTYRVGARFVNIGFANTPHDAVMSNDFYVAIFPITRSQYSRIMGNPVADASMRQQTISWSAARGNATSRLADPGDGPLLNLRERTQCDATPDGIPFNLPTCDMLSVAIAGGTTNTYLSGATTAGLEEYMPGFGKTNGDKSVGNCRPNGFGFFEVCNSGWQLCLDTQTSADWASLKLDGQTPYLGGSISGVVCLGGGGSSISVHTIGFRATSSINALIYSLRPSAIKTGEW